MSDLHDLAAAYVMDALNAAERAEYESHLATCSDCEAEVARLAEPVAEIAGSLATPPPAAMKQAVLGAIAVTPQLGRPPTVVPLGSRRNRAVSWALGIAAVVLAVVAGVALFQLRDARDAVSIITAADVETIVLATEDIDARFTYSTLEGRGIFVSSSLPGVPAGQTYQLWLIDDGGAASAGVFTPDDGVSRVRVSELRAGVRLGLTVEPEGGSASPTGEILFDAPLS